MIYQWKKIATMTMKQPSYKKQRGTFVTADIIIANDVGSPKPTIQQEKAGKREPNNLNSRESKLFCLEQLMINALVPDDLQRIILVIASEMLDL